jgi:hypothetical protein
MEERVRYLEHNGKQILITDLSSLVASEIPPVVVDAARVIRTHPPGSLLTLTIATDARLTLRDGSGEYDRPMVETIRSAIAGNRPHIRASAIVVGPGDAHRILVDFFNRMSDRHFEMFDSLDEALDWLVSS